MNNAMNFSNKMSGEWITSRGAQLEQLSEMEQKSGFPSRSPNSGELKGVVPDRHEKGVCISWLA